MDPISAAGIALSVASLAGQVFTGCIQGIQFIITAKNLPEECKYLNLRLRMEQQRLFAWSETSGLLNLDLDVSDDSKILETNTFVIHRATILDLLVQIQCLFKEFEKAQTRYERLQIVLEPLESHDDVKDPAVDSSSAHVPLSESRKKFIMKAMQKFKSSKEGLKEGRKRLRWAAFDKESFEELLQRFSTLNDNMMNVLDARLQSEIHRTTQDTNRGVLQLHKDLVSLQRLVLALDIKMQSRSYAAPTVPRSDPASDASGLRLLAQLAKFKAFNESMESETRPEWNEFTASVLQLGKPDAAKANTEIPRSKLHFDSNTAAADPSMSRCEAIYDHDGVQKKVWIEWKEYDQQMPGSSSPPPQVVDRVQKLAALLHHSPKPDAFRVPHCLGYFDNANRSESSDPDSDGDEDATDPRIGFVFEKPHDEGVSPDTHPVSLSELLATHPKPRITDRVRLAHAVANCLLYLHSVNWLHKGLRSHNIVFFPVTPPSHGGTAVPSPKIDYSKPYLSGFDFARPARADELTEIPGDAPEYNLYRHPSTQWFGCGPRESFRKTFDIYAFGVVLVELAHWATIDRVLAIPVGRVRLAAKVRERLLEDGGPTADVGASMGEMYEGATRRCIAGGRELGIGEGDDETDDVVAGRLSMAFYEDVVKKLGDVRV